MDVYISEEYVAKRRMERKSAKNSNINSSIGYRSSDNDKMPRPPPTASRPYDFRQNELTVAAPSVSSFDEEVFEYFST